MAKHYITIIQSIFSWQERYAPCFYKKHLHIPCPACGGKTAFLLLCQGQLSNSWHAYPPLLFIIALLFLHTIRIIKQQWLPYKWASICSYAVLSFTIITWCITLKNIL